MDTIKDYIENGIIKEAFQAQMNLQIWNEIAANAEQLSMLDSQDKLLPYLQRSAQSQMVLRTARIFDIEKKYPTRCLDGLFKKVMDLEQCSDLLPNPGGLNSHLKDLNYTSLPNSETTKDEFLHPFIDYCKTEILTKQYGVEIELIKTLRDKYIAHNEAISESITFDPNIVKRLTDLSANISVIIERALIGDSIYLIDDSARRSSYFIKEVIREKLKDKE